MDPIDPNAAPDQNADPAAAAAAPAPDPAPPAPAEAPVDEGLSAIDAGLEAAAGNPPPPAPEQAPDDPTKAPPVDGKPAPEPAKDPAKDPAKEPPAAPAKDEPDPEIAEEAKALGLKDKANDRFVAMATEIKSLAPIKAELEKHGIKDVAEIPQMVERARAADDMIEMVMSTGATSEQYGKTLDYLAEINKAVGGDAKAADRAWEMYLSEGRELAKALGREIPGIFDPLSEHSDLTAAIAAGEMDRKHALEIANARRTQEIHAQAQQQGAQQRQATQAEEQGKGVLAQFDQHMLATDPSYAGKREQLSALVGFIRQTLPPSQWLHATQAAYARIPTPAAPAVATPPPPQQRRPAPGPMRPGPVQQPLSRATFDDPMAALEAGLAAAEQGG